MLDPADTGEGKGYGWMPIPCTDDNFCVHGHCEFKYGHSSCQYVFRVWILRFFLDVLI